jgi:hypothetical protein
MNPVVPKPEMFILPDDTKAVKVAEFQDEFITLPSLITPKGSRISTWKPDANDLILLANGVPVTLVLIMPPNVRQPPVIVAVGGLDLKKY